MTRNSSVALTLCLLVATLTTLWGWAQSTSNNQARRDARTQYERAEEAGLRVSIPRQSRGL